MLQNQTAKTALYARRSPEDKANRQNMFRGDGVTDSIESQLLLLHQYADREGFVNCREYFDDNISGTTFVRKDFARMLSDIQNGEIDTVIVKDLSRLGRDYIESGRYQEVVFPELGTRLVAVLDGYDSQTGAGTDMAAFKNVYNDFFVRDISKKTRSALRARATAGKCVSAGIYGYMKDPEDKNHLIPDPETAPVVQRIFSMVADGYSFRYIARTLASENILTPSAYRGLAPRSPLTRPTDWNPISLAGMIRDPQYLGKIVYGRKKKVSYKSRKQVSTSEQEQIVVDNTHEPLVSQEIWELANDVANRNHKTTKTGKPHLFSGLLYCADCDSAMAVGAYQTFVCRRYKSYNRSENGCTSHSIPYKVLYAAVLTSIQEVTQAAQLDREALINRLSGIGHKKQQAALASARRDRQRQKSGSLKSEN